MIFTLTITAVSIALIAIMCMISKENDDLKRRLARRDDLHDLLIKKYFKLESKPSNIGGQPVDITVTAADIAKKSQERHTKPVNLRKSWFQEQAELEAQHNTKNRMHEILVNDIENLQGPLPTKE